MQHSWPCVLRNRGLLVMTKPKITIKKYPQSRKPLNVGTFFTKEIFGEDAIPATGRFVIAKRETAKELGSVFIEMSGKVAVPIEAKTLIDSDNFEILEADIIIIPRRKIEAPNSRMHGYSREMIVTSGVLNEME